MEEKKVEGKIEKTFNLEDFIPTLIYKLNSHLAPVIGYGQLLLPKMGDREAKKYVEKIIEEAQQASQIIKDLVNFVKKRRPKKEVVDLNRLIETVLEMEIPILNLKNIEVVKDLSPSLPLTLFDPKQIEQVLNNLMTNAEEAISEFYGFGEIKVKTRVVKDHIEITVSDDGPGIARENISKIFTPFFTTKEKRIGLGLSNSYDTITKHRGVIRVISEWGKGATFIFTLPIIEVRRKEKRKGGNNREGS